MAACKKPRKKHRPKPILRDPIGYVMESLTTLHTHGYPLVDLKIKNSQAMYALLRGTAKKQDINKLVSMCNVTEALMDMGYGKEYHAIFMDGKCALLAIAQRAVRHGKFTPTGEEVGMLNSLMELHDAQLEIITVKDMERAIRTVEARVKHKHKVVSLPEPPKELV